MTSLLGRKAKDVLTGFAGLIIGETAYLTGCRQFLLLPKAKKDGGYPDAVWLDEGRLAIDFKTPAVALEPALQTAGGRKTVMKKPIGFDKPAPLK